MEALLPSLLNMPRQGPKLLTRALPKLTHASTLSRERMTTAPIADSERPRDTPLSTKTAFENTLAPTTDRKVKAKACRLTYIESGIDDEVLMNADIVLHLRGLRDSQLLAHRFKPAHRQNRTEVCCPIRARFQAGHSIQLSGKPTKVTSNQLSLSCDDRF